MINSKIVSINTSIMCIFHLVHSRIAALELFFNKIEILKCIHSRVEREANDDHG